MREDLKREQYLYLKDRLSTTELYVIALYYFENRTLSETAHISRNSARETYRIINKALNMLEKRLRV